VVVRNTSYTPAAAAAAAGSVMQRSRPTRLTDGLSRANNSRPNPPPELVIEIDVTAEPVATSCGCTDLSHHQFHLHHHPPTPHYHANSDVTASSPTDEVADVTPANNLLSRGRSTVHLSRWDAAKTRGP